MALPLPLGEEEALALGWLVKEVVEVREGEAESGARAVEVGVLDRDREAALVALGVGVSV